MQLFVVLISFLFFTAETTNALGVGSMNGGSQEQSVLPVETTETSSGNDGGTSEDYYSEEDMNIDEGYVTEQSEDTDQGDYTEEDVYTDERYYAEQGEDTDEVNNNTAENDYADEGNDYTEGNDNTTDNADTIEFENTTDEVEDDTIYVDDSTEDTNSAEVVDDTSEVEDKIGINDTRGNIVTRGAEDRSTSMTSTPEPEDASTRISLSPEAEDANQPDVALPSQSEPVEFPVDFSTNETSVRTTVFQGDIEATAETMVTSDAQSIGAGLTFDEEFVSLVEPSEDRDSDPDVVAFKALASAAIDTGDASRFGLAVVISFAQDRTRGIFTLRQLDELRIAFTADFSNVTDLEAILSANANQSLTRRRLQGVGNSPVNSFVCSFCWPRKQCRKLHWC